MIAANYLKHPDALRFQRELFHNGYKNSPRIMRLMECVFKFAPDVPGWAKEVARKARQLVKVWKGAQIAMNFKAAFEADKKANELCCKGFYGYMDCENGNTWTGRGLEPKWVAGAEKRGALWYISPGYWDKSGRRTK